MKLTIYSIITLLILGFIGYFQNEYTSSLANKKVKHPYIQNIKKTFGIN